MTKLIRELNIDYLKIAVSQIVKNNSNLSDTTILDSADWESISGEMVKEVVQELLNEGYDIVRYTRGGEFVPIQRVVVD